MDRIKPVRTYIFYVYILFDWLGCPRYVGKGKGDRWNQHECPDPTNWLKTIFVVRTMRKLGTIPKIKVHKNLSETEAFEIETALIKAIGRWPDGPLTNLTDTRCGPSSERMKQSWASITVEERKARGQLSAKTKKERHSPEELSELGRRNALSVGRDALSERMKHQRAKESVEQRHERASKAGAASVASITPERRAKNSKASKAWWSTMSPEERRAFNSRTGLALATKEQLQDWGRKGSSIVNSSRTTEQKRSFASKGAQVLHQLRTPEERRAAAQHAGKIRHSNQTPEQRLVEMKHLQDLASKRNSGSRYINNGTTNQRLPKGEPVPTGWHYGMLKRASSKKRHPR